MNYQQYRAAKESYLRSNPLRLDCMNTQKALSDHAPSLSNSTTHHSSNEAAMAWLNMVELNTDNTQIISGKGIRHLLGHLFHQLKYKGMKFILPRDVYPVYAELLGNYSYDQYHTIPTFNLDFLSSMNYGNYVLLLTLPLTPLGRHLCHNEIDEIEKWLREDKTRLLIVDAAYHYSNDFQLYERLISSNQCICLFSLSKSWLMPGCFGIAISNELEHSNIQPPPEGITHSWVDTFRDHPDLPQELQQLFSDEWDRLKSLIKKASPQWSPPDTGYFSTLNIPFDQLLYEYNTLGIPASVFGSNSQSSTVISCLFDI